MLRGRRKLLSPNGKPLRLLLQQEVTPSPLKAMRNGTGNGQRRSGLPQRHQTLSVSILNTMELKLGKLLPSLGIRVELWLLFQPLFQSKTQGFLPDALPADGRFLQSPQNAQPFEKHQLSNCRRNAWDLRPLPLLAIHLNVQVL